MTKAQQSETDSFRQFRLIELMKAALPSLIAQQTPTRAQDPAEGLELERLSGPQLAEVASAAYELAAACIDVMDISEHEYATRAAAEVETPAPAESV